MDALHILVLSVTTLAVIIGTHLIWPVIRCEALDRHQWVTVKNAGGYRIYCEDCEVCL